MPLILHTVTALDTAGLEPYRTLRMPSAHLQRRIFVAEGAKVVSRLLDTSLNVSSLLLTSEWFAQLRPRLEERATTPMDIFLAEPALVNSIVGYHLHQGIMAVAEVPPEPSFYDLPDVHVIVALDGLTHAENVGLIVRSCAAFGVDAVIAGETSCSPYLRRAVRNSMGGVFQLKVFHATNLAHTLTVLRRDRGTQLVAADANAAAHLGTHPFPARICIIAGNEDRGISPEILELCDDRISIPMHKGTDSLNVATALGVFLYELRRNATPDQTK